MSASERIIYQRKLVALLNIKKFYIQIFMLNIYYKTFQFKIVVTENFLLSKIQFYFFIIFKIFLFCFIIKLRTIKENKINLTLIMICKYVIKVCVMGIKKLNIYYAFIFMNKNNINTNILTTLTING